MPDTCEQKILRAVQNSSEIQQTEKSRITWKKRAVIAGAVAACISVVSVVSVAAAQNTDMLHLLFPEKEQINDTAVEIQTGIENFSYTGFDGMTLTPIGVAADAKQIHVFVQLTADINEISPEYIEKTGYVTTGGSDDIFINGQNGWDENRTDGVPTLSQFKYRPYVTETAGSYTVDISYNFEDILEAPTLQIETRLSFIENPDENATQQIYTQLGTLYFDVNLAQIPGRIVALNDMPLTNAKYETQLHEAEIHAFGMEMEFIKETPGLIYEEDPEEKTTGVILYDGTFVSMWASGGEYSANKPYQTVEYRFDEPIDPEQVAMLRFGDIDIPIDTN